MPTWLIEDPTVVYFLLGAMAIGLGAAWRLTGRKHFLLSLGVVCLLALLVWLIDFLIVTDSEKIIRIIKDMRDGAVAKNTDQIFHHISEKFRVGSLDKKGFRDRVHDALARGEVTDIRVWEFESLNSSRPKRAASVQFLIKGAGSGFRGGEFFRCRASFALDGDDQWRLQSFELFDPLSDPARAHSLALPF